MNQQPNDNSIRDPPRSLPKSQSPPAEAHRPDSANAPCGFLLVSDDSGLYQTPDNEQIMSTRHLITPDRPRLLLQSDDGTRLAVYVNDRVYLLVGDASGRFGPLPPTPDSDPTNPQPLQIPQLVEMTFSSKDLILRTVDRLLSVDLETQTVTSDNEIRLKRPPEVPRDCFVYSTDAEFYTNKQHFQTLLAYHTFRFQWQADDSPASPRARKPMDSFLLRSVEVREDNLRDRMVFRRDQTLFHRNQTHYVFALPHDRLMDVSLEDNSVAFFRASDHNFKQFELADDEFSAFEALRSPREELFLMVFTQLRFGPQKTEKGSQDVFLVDATAESVRKLQAVSGPVYSTCWSHDGQRFVVIAGVGPSYVIVYNRRGEPETHLGRLFANMLAWTPDDTHLAVGGFRMMDNEVTLYKKGADAAWEVACRVPVRGADSFSFFVDSQRFSLSLTHSHASEKNRFQTFNFQGECLYRADFDPSPLFAFEEAKSSELTRPDRPLREPLPKVPRPSPPTPDSQLQILSRTRHQN